jgi:hypothetical protein
MKLKLALASLTKSVLAGGGTAALAATAVAAILTVPFIGNWQDAAQVARLLGAVAAVCFALVLAGALLLGLPTTFVLQRLKRESEGAYVVTGTAFGFILPLVVLFLERAPSGHWVAILGACAGTVAGRVWWRSYRRYVAETETT